MKTTRSILMALSIAFAAGATLTTASLGSQTGAGSSETFCQDATWPAIPADCLAGFDGRDVRVVPILSNDADSMYARFALAFGTTVAR